MSVDHIQKDIDLSVNTDQITKLNKLLKEFATVTSNQREANNKVVQTMMRQYTAAQNLLRIDKERARVIENISTSYSRQAADMKRAWETQRDITRMAAAKDFGGIVKSALNARFAKTAEEEKRAIQDNLLVRRRAIEDRDLDKITKARRLITRRETEIVADRNLIAALKQDEEDLAKGLQSGAIKPEDYASMMTEKHEQAKAASERIGRKETSINKAKAQLQQIESDKKQEIAELEGAANFATQKADLDADKKSFKVEQVINGIKSAAQNIRNVFRTINSVSNNLLGISVSIKDNFMSILTEAGSILNMRTGAATYGTSTSLIMNAEARRQQMKYGLSNAQNWALTRTMSLLNLQNDEDLMYMNQNQRQLFTNFMTKYSRWYDQLESSGVLQTVQQFQLDFAMFKQELAMDFMKWFADNKTLLFDSIKTIARATTWILQALMNLINGFHIGSSWNNYGGTLSGSMSDYINGRSISNSRNVTINVHQSNTATGVLSSQESLQSFFDEAMKRSSQEIASAIQNS